MKKTIFLDYQSTTPVDPRVFEAMQSFFTEEFGNPSSKQHVFGWKAESAVLAARAEITKLLNCKTDEVFFTSGATESNNWVLQGVLKGGMTGNKKNHLIVSQMEHPSVLEVAKMLQTRGCEVTFVEPDAHFQISPQDISRAIKPSTALVSVMWAQHEVGSLQPIPDIAAICKERGVLFHTDATQAVGKVKIDFKSSACDFLTFSSHKIYGPKGVGVLLVKDPSTLSPLLWGGGQEKNMRSGTLNVPGIVGLGKAVQILRTDWDKELSHLEKLQKIMMTEFSKMKGIQINGHLSERIPNNLHLTLEHFNTQTLMMNLRDFALSTGSACSSESLDLPTTKTNALRIGWGRMTMEEEIHLFIQRFKKELDIK